jgi:O-antigen ligase
MLWQKARSSIGGRLQACRTDNLGGGHNPLVSSPRCPFDQAAISFTRKIGSKMVNKSTTFQWHVLAATGGTVVALLFAIPSVRPLWVLIGVLLFSTVLIGFVKFPATLLVPVIFIPQWKTLPFLAALQSTVDLTLVALILLCLLLAFQLIVSLVRGQSISDLFAGQGVGVATFFLFAGVVAASYWYTPAKDWGFTQMTRLCGIGGLLFLSPFILVRQERDFRQFAITFICCASLRAIQPIFYPEYAKWRGAKLAGAVTSDIGAGWLIGMAILLLLYYKLFESRSAQWVVRFLSVPLLAAGLVAATARGPIVSLVLVFFFVAVVSSRYSVSFSRILPWLGILTLISVGGWLSLSSLRWAQTRLQHKTNEIVEIWHGRTSVGSASKRLEFYKVALREIPERPVLGLGTGGWAVYYFGRDMREYPHNLFLLVAVEEGTVGLLALFGFLGTVWFAFRRVSSTTGDRFIVLFSLVLFCLSCSMFSGDLDSNRLLWFWCGMTFAFSRMLTRAAGQPSHLAGSLLNPHCLRASFRQPRPQRALGSQ